MDTFDVLGHIVAVIVLSLNHTQSRSPQFSHPLFIETYYSYTASLLKARFFMKKVWAVFHEELESETETDSESGENEEIHSSICTPTFRSETHSCGKNSTESIEIFHLLHRKKPVKIDITVVRELSKVNPKLCFWQHRKTYTNISAHGRRATTVLAY